MDVTPQYYFLTRVLPITFVSLVLCLLTLFIFSDIFSRFYIRVILLLVPVFVLISTVVYPLTIFQQRKFKIEAQMLMFITRVSIVTYSSIARKNVFDIMKYAEDFDELAIEVNKIYKLIDNWKISTPEACRMIARQTPSDMFADFLDRVAIAIENAENPNSFLETEHDHVLEEYASRYEMMLERFALYREIYTAILSIGLFPFVLFAFIPMLMNMGTFMLMLFSIFMIVICNIILIYIARNILFREKVWNTTGLPTKDYRIIQVMSIIGVSLFVVVALILFLTLYDSWAPLVIVSFAVFPLFIVGAYALYLEEKIKRREEVFAPFMSSLGHSTETKGLEATKALDKLRHHDFGALTVNINDLFLRLKTRIDSELSWEYFGNETNSEMITKFAKFYVEGAKQGGNPTKITNVISKTFIRLKALRKKRYWGSSFFVILSYVIIFISSFVGYQAYFILKMLVDLVEGINPTNEAVTRFQSVAILNPDINLSFVHGVLLAIVVTNIIGATVISRITSGGHMAISLIHLAIYTWVALLGYALAWGLFYYFFA